MWLRVDLVLTDVSEERIASSFRVEKLPRQWSYTGSDPLSVTCSPLSMDHTTLCSIDFPCGSLSLPPSSYTV
jgi:hypothetical protein